MNDDNPPNGGDSDNNDSDSEFVAEDSDEESEDKDSDEEDSDNSMAEEDHDGNLNYIEVKQVGGKYIKFKAATPAQDDDVQSKVKEDERFGANTMRGGARLAMVIVRAVSFTASLPFYNVVNSVDFYVLTDIALLVGS